MSDDHLRRYTNLPALIYLLRRRKLSLLDPQSWDDANDSFYLALYREKRELKSLLTLCFTQAAERYHLWRVFADGSSGVCIRFNRLELLKAMKKQSDVRAETVKYLTLQNIRNKKLAVKDLPFLKRYGFDHENEFRIIYESKSATKHKLDVPIPLSCIDRITLSPWLHPTLSDHVKKILWSIDSCNQLDIVRSTLINNEAWQRLGEHAK